MSHTHDLIVIGAGAAGLGCAGFGSSIGLKVALIDRTAHNFGGDCLNNGCVPSKALLHVASLFAGGRAAERFGLRTEGKADFAKVMAWIHDRQDIIRRNETPEHFREKYGTDCLIGEARLSGPKSVSVNGRTLTAPKIVLATGSVPAKLDVPGAEQVRQWDNESVFWELDQLPEQLLIVGGGPISCELGQAFVRLGSEVTLLVRGERLIEKDPPEMAAILHDKLTAEGLTIRYQTEIARFSSPQEAILEGEGAGAGEGSGGAQGPSGPTQSFTHLLVAIGRNVVTEGLDLSAAGVEVEKGKIVTDPYYRTTNPDVYAIGDAYGAEQFSHGAEFHNTQLWNNLLNPFKKKHHLKNFTWVTFTDPEIASFGMTPALLAEEDIDYETRHVPLAEDDRAVAADFRNGHLIVYLSTGPFGGGKVLGGCLAAPAAGEMIQTLHYLQVEGKKYADLTSMIYAYPVASRIIQKGARESTTELLTGDGRVPKVLRGVYRLWHG